MAEEQEAWARMSGEPLLWWNRFEKFRLMEPVHSIAAVFREEMGGNGRTEPPGRWYEESKKWKWEERAAAWDMFQDDLIEKQIAAERRKVLKRRYALMHKRVELLDRKITQLADITDQEDRVWLADVKAVGTGEFAERVDLVTFNSDAFRELREYLNDMAAEMGERIKKKELSITTLPKVYVDLDEDEDGVDRE